MEDIAGNIASAVAEAAKQLGRVNIVIAGRSGVGKSTLINAVFHENLAETGQGRPVTKETREIYKEGVPVSIYDTRGLEMADYQATLTALRELVEKCGRDFDVTKHIHVAWVCIQEDSRRIEDAEIALHEMLAGHVPVIGVITKARSDQGFKAEVKRLLPQASNVVSVRAIREVFDEGHVLPPMGLQTLVELTLGAVPEGAKRAFAAAQKADINAKKSEARKIIGVAAAASGTAGAVPIPFSDAVVIAPIQIGMIAKITTVFGIELTHGMLSSLVGSAVGVVGASYAGRAIVSGLFKMFPGAGSVAGGAIAGTTAVALTTALGEAYLAALVAIFTENPDAEPTGKEIGERFKRMLTLSQSK